MQNLYLRGRGFISNIYFINSIISSGVTVRLDPDLLIIFLANIAGTTSLPLAKGNIDAFHLSSFSSTTASSPEVHLHSPTRIFFLSRDSATTSNSIW